jgi:uncharacterized membrane protein
MTDVVSRPPVAETDPAPDHGLRSRLAGAYLTWLPLLLIAFGIALRLRQYASRRSLWLDEAYLSLSITDFDYGELSSRLLYDQAAPLGYLWAAKTSVLLIGNNEYALRLPALLAGVAALFLIWRLARRLLSAWLVPAAVGLVAVWPKLVYYSDEAKPYGVDVFAVLLVLWLTARWAEASRSRRTAVVWGLTAGIAIFFSFAALFAAAAGGLAIAVKALLSRDGRRIVDTALAGAVLGALLAVVYVVTIRVAAGNDVVRSAWLSGYAPLPLRARTYASWLADMATGFMTDPLEVQLTVVGLLLLALGVVAVVARRRTVGLAVLLVPLVVLAAATVQAYPVLLRFILFLVPLALIVMTAALDVPKRLPRPASVVVSVLLAAGLAVTVVPPVLAGVGVLGRPMTVTETREIYAQVAADARPGDGVVLHTAAVATFQYYGEPLGLQQDAVVSMRRLPACDDQAQLAKLRSYDRVWVIFAHALSTEPDAVAVYRSRLDTVGTVVRTVTGEGNAAAVLYDLSQPPEDVPEPLAPFRPGQCLVVTA